MVDFEGHQFSCKLTPFSFDSWLNRFAAWASFKIVLYIHHWTIGNEFTVRYAQIYTPLKIPTYPTHPDYFSQEIKFNILGLSKFRFFTSSFVGHTQNDILCVNYACITCLFCAIDINVDFKTFSITWQHISCHDLHLNVFPTCLCLLVYVVKISNESVHKGNF